MAQHVLVKNIGEKPYVDTFRDEPINISPGGTVTMQRREAITFLGRMSNSGKDGKPIEKKLVMIPISGAQAVAAESEKKFVCNLDGHECGSQEELDEYLKRFASKTVKREQIDRAKKESE